MTVSAGLVGNPNTGKSTLFNALTGLSQRVGNYPGVTVERKTGSLRLPDGTEAELVDLPGVYSLSVDAPDERVAAEVLLEGRRDEVDAVLDVPIADLLALFEGSPSLTVQGVSFAGHPDAREVTLEVTLDNLVPGAEYWVVLMVMAQRYLAGQHPLAV